MKKLLKSTDSGYYPPLRQIFMIYLLLWLLAGVQSLFAQERKITLDLEQVTLEKALNELMNQTDVQLIYNAEQLKDKPAVTIHVKNETVENTLQKLLQNTGLTYQKVNETIVIGPEKPKEEAPGFRQTLRGTIIDKDSRSPLPFATVQVLTVDPVKGAVSDLDGQFRIDQLPIGRHAIKVTFVGYEEAFLSDILVGTGRETILTIPLAEQLTALDEVVVSASNGLPLNEMATVSAKSFDSQETKRYAASISDPARMVQVFAGVSGTDDASNEIVIRGNSPNWMLWKLEGVEIPSPNHFAEEGYSAGAVSILSANMLGSSDFYTGAFSADYGNALSGIFDLRLRNGNNQEYEHVFQAGVLGFDIASEGPFKKGKPGSYLFNYRYSTLSLLNNLNFEVSENALPNYQDLSFKFHLPTENAGTFSLWGVGGFSDAHESYRPDSTDIEDYQYGYTDITKTDMHAAGITHTYFIDNQSFFETVISQSKAGSANDVQDMDSLWRMYDSFHDHLEKGAVRVSSFYNRKYSNRLTMRYGVIASRLDYNYRSEDFEEDTQTWNVVVNSKGHTYLIQGYAQAKYKLSERISATGGLHYTRFQLNQDAALEPRFGMVVDLDKGQQLTFGFGRHSRHENLPVYFVRNVAPDGSIYLPNKNLEMTRATHAVVGYQKFFSSSLMMKVEAYYQYSNNLPVPNNPHKYWSPIFGGFTGEDTLVNQGKSRNMGLEFTLQRFFADRYYFLVTSSLFDAKYQALDGRWRDTRYNIHYVNNVVGGKEFKWGDHRLVGINAKVLWSGGKRQIPINLERSREEEQTVWDDDRLWSEKTKDYFRIDAGVRVHFYKKDKEHVLSLDIQNLTNRLNTWSQFYDVQQDRIADYPMAGLIPILNYRYEF